MNFILIFCSLTTITALAQATEAQWDDKVSTYKAAVVEFNVRFPAHKRINNTIQVVKIINSDETKNVDIIVFPECILNNELAPIPLSKSIEGYSPCDLKSVHWALHDIACAARRSSTYVVIDLITTDDVGAIYNTALVFDRNGVLIAKYRKYHLYGEPHTQRPSKPDVITFTTDFNVTFGIFICFDLMFEEPAITLVKKGIKNFVYPTMWFSELPFLTAVQIQRGWAYTNNVNLLAADANRLETATFGSGIYAGQQGSLVEFIPNGSTTKVIIADVPIDSSSDDHLQGECSIYDKNDIEPTFPALETEYNLWKEDLSSYTINFLNTSGVQSGELHSNGIHCNYTISIADMGQRENENTYFYAIAFLDGYRSYPAPSTLRTAQKICGVIACTKLNDWKSCGQRHNSSVEVHKRFRIDRLELNANLQMSNMSIIPNTVAMNLKSFQKFNWSNSVSEDASGPTYKAQMKMTEPISDILTFSIYARDFQHDILNTNS